MPLKLGKSGSTPKDAWEWKVSKTSGFWFFLCKMISDCFCVLFGVSSQPESGNAEKHSAEEDNQLVGLLLQSYGSTLFLALDMRMIVL